MSLQNTKAETLNSETGYICPVCGPQIKPCSQLAADYNALNLNPIRYEVFAIRKTKGKCLLKLWNQRLGCFQWIQKPITNNGPFLRKI